MSLPLFTPSPPPDGPADPTSSALEDFYSLLGLPPFESAQEVIASRAREMMKEARKYQVGPYATRTQVRLEHLAAATACLLDPAQKTRYDEALRRQYGLPPISTLSTFIPAAQRHDDQRPTSTAARPPARKGRAIVGLATLAGLGVVFWLNLNRSGDSPRWDAAASDPALPSTGAPPADGERLAKNRLISDQASSSPTPSPGTASVPSVLGMDDTGSTVPDSNAKSSPRPLSDSVAGSPTENGSAKYGSSDTGNALARRGGEPSEVTQAPQPPVTDRSVATASEGLPSTTSTPPVSRAANNGTIASQEEDASLELTTTEVLRELKTIRTRRTPARTSRDPRLAGPSRVVELVRYGRRAFSADQKFQKKLDAEVGAQLRAFPQLRPTLQHAPP
ncbi:MAG: hypothetical protein ACKV0T_20480 [Planctomycetales bacterium]